MPKDGLPTVEDFIQVVRIALIMQDSILEFSKILKDCSDDIQSKFISKILSSAMVVVEMKILLDKIDPGKLIPIRTELLQFADPPEPEVVQ